MKFIPHRLPIRDGLFVVAKITTAEPRQVVEYINFPAPEPGYIYAQGISDARGPDSKGEFTTLCIFDDVALGRFSNWYPDLYEEISEEAKAQGWHWGVCHRAGLCFEYVEDLSKLRKAPLS